MVYSLTSMRLKVKGRRRVGPAVSGDRARRDFGKASVNSWQPVDGCRAAV
jgi:hypothetical protein